ncbi:MAG: SUMF1/EgtB/PvdO family nonheme iron enzyme [Chitinispirillia bacterium]|nr:SUMF1/EgtB/PvdO family nonheme iron enzyme [Chitinispirillia bacterium]
MPWVYADPSGGLHRKAVNVKLTANKPSTVEFRFERDGKWKKYDGTPINIMENAVLYYKATDACGKEMKPRSKRYEFNFTDKSEICPAGMEYIETESGGFCIDKHLWPNRRGVTPAAFVSFFQAMDSCFSVDKRLCTSNEWSGACAGPQNWSYIYGDNYEPNTCVTHDTTARQTGSRSECRGYFEVFDMSGNLAEWTSTVPARDRTLRNVMGGFWASGSQSRCTDVRYSYFPQNRHNPVGFRCCKDAAQPDGSSSRPNRSRR